MLKPEQLLLPPSVLQHTSITLLFYSPTVRTRSLLFVFVLLLLNVVLIHNHTSQCHAGRNQVLFSVCFFPTSFGEGGGGCRDFFTTVCFVLIVMDLNINLHQDFCKTAL